MLNEVLKIYEKMICVDVRRANAKQQETKELVDVGILPIFTRSIYLKNLKWNRKMACIFYLILVVIFHPVWYCPLTGWVVFLLNGQNLLSMTKVICWWSLNGKVSLTLYFSVIWKNDFCPMTQKFRHYCTFVPSYRVRVRVRAAVKLSTTFFHDESSITIGGGIRKGNSTEIPYL